MTGVFGFVGATAADFHLRDPSCIGSMSDDVFVFEAMLNNCGTKRMEVSNGQGIGYKNLVYSAEGTPVLEMNCIYTTGYDIEAVHIITNPCVLLAHFIGFDTFNLSVTLYKDDSFSGHLDPVTDFPIQICDSTLLYFGIMIDNNDDYLELFVENCFISESVYPELTAPTYDFITDGCLTDDVAELDVVPANRLERHYSVYVYGAIHLINTTVVGENIDLYLHCSVDVCKVDEPGTPCDLGCMNGRKRRDSIGLTKPFVTHGPFNYSPGKRCNSE
ncbi:CUB and zona pellucida-like domain-containing protein 1 [Glandiceps talaboti]